MATSGDFLMATCGDFLMATDTAGDIENAIRVVRKSVAGQLGRFAVATQLGTRQATPEDVKALAVVSV